MVRIDILDREMFGEGLPLYEPIIALFSEENKGGNRRFPGRFPLNPLECVELKWGTRP